jgi:outer membrane protein assembly factor BamA
MRQILLILGFIISTLAFGQDNATRADVIRQEIAKKQTAMKAEAPTRAEQGIEWVNNHVLENFFEKPVGVVLKFGGLMQGSGFAIGPRYKRFDLAGERVKFDAYATASIKRYYAGQVRVRFPRIAGSRFDGEVFARRSDSPRISYFGPGPNSSRKNLTNYRREDNEVHVRFGWRPDRRNWLLSYEFAALKLNVGPGIGIETPSTEKVFSPLVARGIDKQSHYLYGGPVLRFDNRDRPGDPHKGGNYWVGMTRYWDRSNHLYSFTRVSAGSEFYLPFWNEKRVLAFRLKTDLSYNDKGNFIPFYMQPSIGGPDDVRGFQRFRFQDSNATIANVEYRWEVSPMLDVALFGDAGNVFSRPGLIGFHDLKTAGGMGFRVKTRESVFMRLDAGAGKEGFRIWLTFSNVF